MGNNLSNIEGGSTHHKMHLSEPWFTLIHLGLKKTEGRLNKGQFAELQDGDIIEWYNDDFKHRKCLTKIIKKIEYKSFQEYLHKEGLQNCLPGMPDIDHGLSVYYKYYTKEDENKFGVISIRLIKI
jgi:ASC-1-like (ASCH) protein